MTEDSSSPDQTIRPGEKGNAQPPSDWKTGETILDTYEVKGTLGKGGFGKVYRVHHKSWNIDLAVKRALTLEEDNKQSFIDEAQHWIDLGLHPHIISCYYVRNIDGFPHTFAELAEGRSLHDWIQRDSYDLYEGGKDQALQRTLDIAIQFAWGLAYAHQQGLVHQDVKPQNALMTPEGILKVTDFGLAKARGSAQAGGQQSPVGDLLVSGGAYSPYHCSPEQASGEKLSLKTDIWSWAVSVLEMFNGGVSWMGGQVADTALESYLQRAGEEEDIPPMPADLADLIRQCLQPDPKARPADMLVIAEQILSIYQQAVGQAYPRQMPKAAELRADSLNNKALSLLDLGKEEEAVAAWQKALGVDPHHSEATYNIGMHRWQAAQQTDLEVVKQLEAVISTQSGAWTPYYYLGLVHMQRRDIPAASQSLDKAERISPGVEQVQSAIRRLDGISPMGFLHTLSGHTYVVITVAITPDGRQAVSCSGDHTLRVWDLESGKCLHILEGHKDWVQAIAITPDGRQVISGSKDKTLRVWDLMSGECLHILEGHTELVNSVAITPDGRHAVSTSEDGALLAWDLESGKYLHTLEENVMSSVAITPNGCRVISGCYDDTLRVWDLESGKCLHTFEEIHASSVAITPDGHRVVSGLYEKMLRVWDLKSGECLHILEGHTDRITLVVITPDRHRVVSGSKDNTLRLWDLESGECLRILEGHTDWVEAIAISPDGRQMISGSRDKTMRVWDLESGECLRTLEGHTGWVGTVAITPDGRQIVSGSNDKTLRVWYLSAIDQKAIAWAVSRPPDIQSVQSAAVVVQQKLKTAQMALQNGKARKAANILKQALTTPGFERDSAVLALWHAAGRRAGLSSGLLMAHKHHTLEGHTSEVRAIALTPDGRQVVSGSRDHTLRVWALDNGECLHILKGHMEWVLAIAITPDGRKIISGSYDKTLRVWDLESGECLHILEGHTDWVEAIAISRDGCQMISGSRDKTMRVWDLESGECLRTLEGHKNRITSVAISLDGRQIVSSTADETLRVWDLETSECLRTLKGHNDSVETLVISPDGRQVVSGSRDNTLRIWDLQSGECLRTLEGHTKRITSVAISPDGRQAVSGSGDETLRVWDLKTGECLRILKGHKGWVDAVAITPNGRKVISGSFDKTLCVWNLDWDYEFPDPVDWDNGAKPYLDNFLMLHMRTQNRLFKKRKLIWTEEEFQQLLVELGYRGYGWLRAEGVRKKLAEMAAERD